MTKALCDGAAAGASFGYDEEVEHALPAFLAEEPKPARHKWGPEKFSGSFVSHSRVAICTQCGTERHRRWNYGERDTVFQQNGEWWSSRTRPCEKPLRRA